MKNLWLLVQSSLFIFGCYHADHLKEKDNVESQIEHLLSKMTLEEKIGQTSLRGTSSRGSGIAESLKEDVRNGKVGALLNIKKAEHVKELQRIATEESPNKIPLIFGRDIIHGFKTIFPIPLGQAASWNPNLVRQGAKVAAKEATSRGIRWTFAPMVDITRDPRWGRIAESPGEDPYLASILSEAYVQGFQGEDISNSQSLVACTKHFAGYGAAEGGRDYNTAILDNDQLYNVFLPPFQAAVKAGTGTFMSGFNELNGVPVTGNEFLLTDVLRNQWSFDGFVVSDWNSVIEMVAHGYAEDTMESALKAANAGLDMEMTSTSYENHLQELISEGKISESQLDEIVRNILRVKFRMGLFENVNFDTTIVDYQPDHLQAAKQAAIESFVLLKNEASILPLDFNSQKVAVIGPLANAPHEQLGTWTFDGEKEQTITPLQTLQEKHTRNVSYRSGLSHSRDQSKKGFQVAIQTARSSDVILFFGGEEAILSGEAHSRAKIDLPGAQEELIKELSKLNKPIVLIILAGRPITLGNIIDDVDAILMAWHPGTMGGPALIDVLDGTKSPSGRLPVTWPKSVGQIPIYYNHKNTGRPASNEDYVHMDDIPIGAWQSSLGNDSHYLDDGFTPLYPFGYGLTYSTFNYSGLNIDQQAYTISDSVQVSFKLENIGEAKATELVQYYFQDVSASLTRPVRQLIGFEKVTLKAGESQIIQFNVAVTELGFYNQKGEWVIEPGKFNFWVAPNALAGLKTTFEVLN